MAISSSADWARIPGKPLVTPEPFSLQVADQEVQDFKTLLKLSKLRTKTFENQQTDRHLGINQSWMINAVSVWQNEYSWTAAQARINRHPQFMTSVEDSEFGTTHKIHFAALFSHRQDALPLCFLHGWPGSFLEFHGILDIIRAKYSPQTSPYHIIVPSLPGYNMSSGPPIDADFSLLDCARVIDLLMQSLGFADGYALQGGDIGSMLAPFMAKTYPERVKAIHVNFVGQPKPSSFPDPAHDPELTDRDREKIARATALQKSDLAWAPLQASKPATIGTVLNTNPIAQLAWVAEKMLAWADPARPIPLEVILDHVTLYWFTDSLARNMWAYRSMFRDKIFVFEHVEQPVGYSRFPYDLDKGVRKWVETMGNLVFYRERERGGHFAAVEEGEGLWQDVEEFLRGALKERF